MFTDTGEIIEENAADFPGELRVTPDAAEFVDGQWTVTSLTGAFTEKASTDSDCSWDTLTTDTLPDRPGAQRHDDPQGLDDPSPSAGVSARPRHTRIPTTPRGGGVP